MKELKVADKCCGTCIFGNNTPISPERHEQFIADTLTQDTYVICHSDVIARGEKADICCRGFWEAHNRDSFLTRMALMLKAFRFVPLAAKGNGQQQQPDKEENKPTRKPPYINRPKPLANSGD